MAGATIRNEYYWEEGRVVRRPNFRPTGWAGWKKIGPKEKLVGTIEYRDGRMTFEPGEAWTERRKNDALMLEMGQVPGPRLPDKDMRGVEVPPRLVEKLEARVRRAESRILRRFDSFSHEDHVTSAFFHDLHDDYEVDGWKVSVKAQHHSSQVKEKLTGADVGIVVDVLAPDERRAMKAIWLQAKKTGQLPGHVDSLPRMKAQLAKMGEHTEHHYGIVYAPTGIQVYGPSDEHLSTAKLLGDAVRCKRGDRDPAVLMNTYGARDYLEILIGPKRR